MLTKYILQFTSVFINELLVVTFVYYSSNKKFKITLKNFLIILFCALLVGLNSIYSIAETRLLCNYLIGILMFVFLDSKNLKKNLFYFSCLMLFGIIIEIIFSLIISISFKNIYDLPFIFQIIIAILGYLFWFGSWYLFLLNNKIRFILIKLEKIIRRTISSEILIMTVFLIIDIILVKNYISLGKYLVIFAVILILNVLFILVIFIIKTKVHEKFLEKSNKILKNNIKVYEKVIDDHNIIRHNLISDLLIIKSVSGKKAQKIIDEKIISYQKNYEWINSINKIPEGIKGLICLKISEAKIKKVNIVTECSDLIYKDITKYMSAKKYLSICEALEILIDNAIEAASECQNKLVRIKIFSYLDNKIVIEILNPFQNEINITKFGSKEYSTKKRKSGYGLYYLLNSNININFKIINNIYIAKLVFSIKKQKATLRS